jgi:hypothetical protein
MLVWQHQHRDVFFADCGLQKVPGTSVVLAIAEMFLQSIF